MDDLAKRLTEALAPEPLEELAPPQRDRIFEIGLLLSYVARELDKKNPNLERVSKQMARTARSLMRQDRPKPTSEQDMSKFWPSRDSG
jgi:hypothetical protein